MKNSLSGRLPHPAGVSRDHVSVLSAPIWSTDFNSVGPKSRTFLGTYGGSRGEKVDMRIFA